MTKTVSTQEFVVFRSLVTFVTTDNRLVTFEMGGHKICEIKIGKGTTPCRPSTAVDPVKRDAKRVRIELAVLDFRRWIASSPPVPDAVSFLGTGGFPCSRPGSPLRFAIGCHVIDQGLSPYRYALY